MQLMFDNEHLNLWFLQPRMLMTDNPGESKKQLHMKTIQHISTRDAIDNRMNMSNRQNKVPKPKLSTGSVTGKYPVILDDGRTIIYITDKSRESEIRSRYALRK